MQPDFQAVVVVELISDGVDHRDFAAVVADRGKAAEGWHFEVELAHLDEVHCTEIRRPRPSADTACKVAVCET